MEDDMFGKLYVVATPLGNLKDITYRAVQTLEEVDFVLAEDSRVAHKLLNSVNLKKDIVVYHQHSTDVSRLQIFERFKSGKSAALVTDAGTPGISDPGNELIHFLTTFNPNFKVVPIPGPSAVTALLSVCGFNTQQFSFYGFLPKKKLTKLFYEFSNLSHPYVFFESPHRIIKTLDLLNSILPKESLIVLGRELTKLHETILRGDINFVINELKKTLPVKGEIVVVVNPNHI